MSTPAGIPLPIVDSDFHFKGADAGAPPDAWLEAIVRIRDVPHYCEAIAVRVTGDGGHEALSPTLQDRLMGGVPPATALRWATVPIGAREYVVFVTPFPA